MTFFRSRIASIFFFSSQAPTSQRTSGKQSLGFLNITSPPMIIQPCSKNRWPFKKKNQQRLKKTNQSNSSKGTSRILVLRQTYQRLRPTDQPTDRPSFDLPAYQWPRDPRQERLQLEQRQQAPNKNMDRHQNKK